MIQFQENTQMSGSKDGQILFHGILLATARGLASKTAINWHLKVKNIEYNVGLTNNYCITVSMKKVSSIHKYIQILGSHELNDYTQFWTGPPKKHWNNFLLSWICATKQKMFISSIHSWDTANFLAMPIQKFSDQLLIHVNLNQHPKHQAISLIWGFHYLINMGFLQGCSQ